MTLLHVEGLQVRYGPVLALEDVTLALEEGERVGLVGSNGAGKTTVLRAITGLLRFHGGQVTAGAITFDGRPIAGRDAAELVGRGIAQVLEGRRVFANLSVADNLRVGAFSPRARREERRRREGLLAMFPVLGRRLDQPAGLLSGGEQQMLAIARALMASPRLLLLDEPSLGLAPRVVAEIALALREIVATGTTLLLVEQSTALALRTTDRAYLLETGRVRAQDATKRLLEDERVRESYLGIGAVAVG